jgi:hypothetical protein
VIAASGMADVVLDVDFLAELALRDSSDVVLYRLVSFDRGGYEDWHPSKFLTIEPLDEHIDTVPNPLRWWLGEEAEKRAAKEKENQKALVESRRKAKAPVAERARASQPTKTRHVQRAPPIEGEEEEMLMIEDHLEHEQQVDKDGPWDVWDVILNDPDDLQDVVEARRDCSILAQQEAEVSDDDYEHDHDRAFYLFGPDSEGEDEQGDGNADVGGEPGGEAPPGEPDAEDKDRIEDPGDRSQKK